MKASLAAKCVAAIIFVGWSHGPAAENALHVFHDTTICSILRYDHYDAKYAPFMYAVTSNRYAADSSDGSGGRIGDMRAFIRMSAGDTILDISFFDSSAARATAYLPEFHGYDTLVLVVVDPPWYDTDVRVVRLVRGIIRELSQAPDRVFIGRLEGEEVGIVPIGGERSP